MVNDIKSSGAGDGLALQVTTEARSAGLIEEDQDGDATRLAEVLVYGVDGLLLVIDEKVSMTERADLVASAIRDTDSIHRGGSATLEIAGNGYQVQFPGCRRAGFDKGDAAPVVVRTGVLFVHDGSTRRLVEDLATIRENQISTGS